MATDDRPHSASQRAGSAGSAGSADPRQAAAFTAMLRGSLLPTLAVAVLAVGLAAFLGGPREAGSAALGAALVATFFSLSLLVMQRTAHLAPVAAMSVVLATYTGKMLALGAAMVLLRDAAWIAGRALALSIIACTVVWLAFEMRAFTRLRVLVAPGADGSPGPSSPVADDGAPR